MYEKIILHIGLEKTASTSMQKFCSDNRADLMRKGIFYPAYRDVSHSFLTFYYADIGRADDVKSPPSVSSNLHHRGGDKCSEKIKSFAGSNCVNVLILSDERLSSRLTSPEKISILKDDLLEMGKSIEVVVFLRDPVAYLVSLYQEAVKAGAWVSLIDWVNDFDYIDVCWDRLLTPWRMVFRDITVVEYKETALADFVDVIARSSEGDLSVFEGESRAAKRKNVGISSLAIKAMRFSNKLMRKNFSNSFIRALNGRFLRFVPGRKFMASERELSVIRSVVIRAYESD